MAKKKSKGVVFESAPPPSGAGGFHNPSARQKREALMVDYQELQKDTDATRSKLKVAKQKRLVLAAEVGFLRRKYKHLVKAKNMISSEEYSIPPSSLKRAKSMKEQNGGNKVGQRRLPPLPDPRPNKKQCTGKRVALLNTSPSTFLACNDILHGKKETFGYSLNLGSVPHGKVHVERRTLVPIIDKERALVLGSNGVASRHLNIGNFELNRYKNFTGQASLPIRAPTFDLNEISTGDEDLQNNINAVRFEEAKRSLMRGASDEKFPICRNAGEGSGTVSKRKISWQDPVVLRV